MIEEVLPGRDRPDAGEAPTHRLEAGTELVELERLEGWVRVATSDGRTVWVDGHRLPSPPPEAPVEARSRGVIATVVVGLGLLIVVVGLGLLLTRGGDDEVTSVPETVPPTETVPATETVPPTETVPATVTEPATDTTAASATLLIEEDFEGSVDWPVGTEGPLTRTVVDGVYRIDHAPAEPGVGYTWLGFTPSPSAARFSLWATVGERSPFGAGCGLAMATGDPAMPRITVLFNDNEGGQASAFLEPAWDGAITAFIDWTSAPPDQFGGSIDMNMVVEDGQLELRVGEVGGADLTLVGTLEVGPIVPAEIALVVVTPSDGAPSNCTFDDVLLVVN